MLRLSTANKPGPKPALYFGVLDESELLPGTVGLLLSVHSSLQSALRERRTLKQGHSAMKTRVVRLKNDVAAGTHIDSRAHMLHDHTQYLF
jgi:hypothetical protein